MLFEDPLDLGIGRNASLVGRLEAAINPGEFRPRCLIFSASEAGIDFKRDLRKLGLRLFRPFFCAFQNVFEKFGRHNRSIAY